MVAYRAVQVAEFIMADKNIVDDIIAQKIVFNELKQDMIKHGVKFCNEMDNNKPKIEVINNPPEPRLKLNGVEIGRFCYDSESAEYKFATYPKFYCDTSKETELSLFIKNKLAELNDSWNDKTGMCTIRDYVRYAEERHGCETELTYLEGGKRYKVHIKVDINNDR